MVIEENVPVNRPIKKALMPGVSHPIGACPPAILLLLLRVLLLVRLLLCFNCYCDSCSSAALGRERGEGRKRDL